MASALDYAGYEHRFVAGDRGHDAVHGSAILPDALRWLWKDWARPIEVPRGRAGSDRHYATEILDPAHDWELVSEGHELTEGPAVDPSGNVYFTDMRARKVFRVEHATGKVRTFKEDSGGANGLMFGPDGRLYACQFGRKRIVAWDPDGGEAVLAEGTGSNDLVVSARGEVWFTDPHDRQVRFIDRRGRERVVNEGIGFPNGIVLLPDQRTAVVADYASRWVWSFTVGADGSLDNGQPFYRLETTDEALDAAPDGMAVDSEGFLYVATRLGVQVCDQPGRVVAIIRKPQGSILTNVVFGGPDLDTLYATAGDKVFRRVLRRHGVFPWKTVSLPRPRL
jgi:gluconolactonase